MTSDADIPKDEEGIEVSSYFVRERNVLVTRANFSRLFMQYYLHQAEYNIDYEPKHDEMLKIALAAFTLHCASHPRQEVLAWTINFQNPLINIFVGGDTDTDTVTGRLFTENVKVAERNSFYQEIVRPGEPINRSYVSFSGRDSLIAAERFYERSEQRPAKYFQIDTEEFIMVSAHPDYDVEWFNGLTIEAVRTLEKDETMSLIHLRKFRWHCGCSEDRIFEILSGMSKSDFNEFFSESQTIIINCPRCCAQYAVTKDDLEAYIEDNENQDENA